MEPKKVEENIKKAANAIQEASALLIIAGAGMGVDSGLPDFRGPEGFWRAYPPMKQLNLKLEDMSNPTWFKKDPSFAWGFFGHRYDLYSSKEPHEGYHILKKWANHIEQKVEKQTKKKTPSYFIFTTNVDGHFEKLFPSERIEEYHGSIHHLQCAKPCCDKIWSVESVKSQFEKQIIYDKSSFRVMNKQNLPKCIQCGNLARPNILMFGDFCFVSDRSDHQTTLRKKFIEHLENVNGCANMLDSNKIVVIEIGAGTYVPTCRRYSESLSKSLGQNATLIRLNPREFELDYVNESSRNFNYIPLPLGSKYALKSMDELLKF